MDHAPVRRARRVRRHLARKRDNLKTANGIHVKFYMGIIWPMTINWFEIGDDLTKIVTLMEVFVIFDEKFIKLILISFLNGMT